MVLGGQGSSLVEPIGCFLNGLVGFWLTDAELVHSISKGIPTDVEKLGCLCLVSAGYLECLSYQVLLHLLQGNAFGRDSESFGRLSLSGDLVEDLHGEMLHDEGISIPKNHRPLDHIFQFPDISRPRVCHKKILHSLRDFLDVLMEFLVVCLDEVFYQGKDVIWPLP